MYQDNIVLCGASSYEQKYYFNQDFASLPQSVQDELHIDRKSTRLNSSHMPKSRMPSSA